MKKKKLLLAIVLFVIGAIGVLSLLTTDIPLPAEVKAELMERFSQQQIKFITLVNPCIMLIVTVIFGTILYDKVGLTVPILEKLVGLKNEKPNIAASLKYGIIGGLAGGILISIVALIFVPLLPTEFTSLGENLKPSLATRFLYGGFTEEILIRFGLMTIFVWVCSKVFKGTPRSAYIIGIVLSTILFATGHFPIVFQIIDSPSMLLLSYVLIGNSIGGLIFGWLYWKKGLESAFVAHILAHVAMVLIEFALR